SAGADDAAGHGEQAEAEAFGLPSAGGVMLVVDGQGLGPGNQIAGQGDDLEPDPVGVVAVDGQVGQASVFEAADAVLGAGALAVADLEGGQRPTGAAGVGRKTGDAPAIVISQP